MLRIFFFVTVAVVVLVVTVKLFYHIFIEGFKALSEKQKKKIFPIQ